jgi:hypothetical protein
MVELKYRALTPPFLVQVSSLSWLANVLSSVSIVFANKHLMSKRGFHFATSLTALHFACCSLVLKFRNRGSKGGIPLGSTLRLWAHRAEIIIWNNKFLAYFMQSWRFSPLLRIHPSLPWTCLCCSIPLAFTRQEKKHLIFRLPRIL